MGSNYLTFCHLNDRSPGGNLHPVYLFTVPVCETIGLISILYLMSLCYFHYLLLKDFFSEVILFFFVGQTWLWSSGSWGSWSRTTPALKTGTWEPWSHNWIPQSSSRRNSSLRCSVWQGRTGGKKWPGSYCQTGPLNTRCAAHSVHCALPIQCIARIDQSVAYLEKYPYT